MRTAKHPVAELINYYWVQFGKTGSPNGSGLPTWQVYDLENKRHQILDIEISQGENDRKAELDLMDVYMRNTYRSSN